MFALTPLETLVCILLAKFCCHFIIRMVPFTLTNPFKLVKHVSLITFADLASVCEKSVWLKPCPEEVTDFDQP